MKFAARHNYTDILDAAAPYAIGTDLKAMKEILPTSLILPWVTFNDAYNQIAQGLPRMLSQEVNVDEEGPKAHYDGYHDTYDGYHDTYDGYHDAYDGYHDTYDGYHDTLAVVDGGAQNLRDRNRISSADRDRMFSANRDRIFSLDLFQRVAACDWCHGACDWCHGALSGYKFNVAQQMKELREKHPFSSYVRASIRSAYSAITGMDPGEDPRVDALRRRNEALAKEKEAIEVDKEALRIELQRAVDARARAEAEAAKAKDVAVQAGRHVAEAHARAANAIRELIMAKDEIRQLKSQVRRHQEETEATQRESLRSQRRACRLFDRLEQARAILYAEDDNDESASDGDGGPDIEMQDFKIEQKPNVPPALTPPPDTQPSPRAAEHGEADPEGAEAAVSSPANASHSPPISTDRAEDSPMYSTQSLAPEPYPSASALFSIQTSRAIALPSLIGVCPPRQVNSDHTTEPAEGASIGKKRKWTTTIMKTWVGTNPSTTKPDLEVRDPRARARLDRK
ncbi:hypothetical protein FB107DRAFT_293472 [Schizophyllum commune]